jgi:hypothetical protein
MELFSLPCIVPLLLCLWLLSYCNIRTTNGSKTTWHHGTFRFIFVHCCKDQPGLLTSKFQASFLLNVPEALRVVLRFYGLSSRASSPPILHLSYFRNPLSDVRATNSLSSRLYWAACSLFSTAFIVASAQFPLQLLPPLAAALQLSLLRTWPHALCISQLFNTAAFSCYSCYRSHLQNRKMPRLRWQ